MISDQEGPLAREISSYSLFQLKNKVEQVGEMTAEEQEEIRNIIRDAALQILKPKENAPKGT